MTTRTVSVVMPAWNAERFIEEALRSVLDQTVLPDTVIVVDDGSTDGTAALAASADPRVRVLRTQHAGIGPARTAGVAATSSELIAFLDADDVWLPSKLEKQLAVMDADPAVEAVFCLTDEFCDETDPPPPGVRAPQYGAAAALSCAALVRRGLIARLGPFQATPLGEWSGWWARARAQGIREEFVPEVLLRRRLHGNNNSHRRDDQGQTLLGIAREHLHALRARSEGT